MLKIILKMTLILIASIIAILLIVGFLFVNLSPEFGGSPSKEEKTAYQKTGHYDDGKFLNQTPTSMDMNFSSIVSTLKEFIKGVPNDKPNFQIPVKSVDSLNIDTNNRNRLIWFGHSAFLLQLDGKNILIDPMFGNVPAPHPWLGGKRFGKLPIEVSKLPTIDLVIISHDHYDHLDYGSIDELKAKTKHFFIPLGVGAHLRKWGVDENKLTEFDWWEQKKMQDIDFTFAPARHFSGRGLGDRSSTLWGSWIIKSKDKNLFFSGDSGYESHFKTIGEKYGPFDFAMMECGQYNEKWAQIHMMPEETAQAALDVKANVMMPIHWAAFKLALHSWTDPVERVTKKAKELNLTILVPQIGSSIWLNDLTTSNEKWWIKKN